MRKLFLITLFVGCIFFAGMHVGATMKENETQSIYAAYEDWQKEQAEKKEQQTKHEANEQKEKSSIFSKTAKSFTHFLKNLSRTVVFQVLSIFEKLIGAP